MNLSTVSLWFCYCSFAFEVLLQVSIPYYWLLFYSNWYTVLPCLFNAFIHKEFSCVYMKSTHIANFSQRFHPYSETIYWNLPSALIALYFGLYQIIYFYIYLYLSLEHLCYFIAPSVYYVSPAVLLIRFWYILYYI